MRKFTVLFTVFLMLLFSTMSVRGNDQNGSQADVCVGPDIVTVNFPGVRTGVTLLKQDRNGMTVRVNVGSIEFIPVSTQAGNFILPRVPGFSRSFAVGQPTLPIASKLISIPFGGKLKAEIVSRTKQDVVLSDYNLLDPFMPVQPSLSKSEDPQAVPFEYDRATYELFGKYALPLANAEVLGVMRSTRLGRIAVSPVEYYPAQNKMTVSTSVTIKITYLSPNWTQTDKMQKKYGSLEFDGINRSLLNYSRDFNRHDLTKYPTKLAIVANRMFESQLQPFIQWKTRKGFKVVVGYTDTIGTTTTAIKTWIQNLYNAGIPSDPAPSFVLLVGDVQQIPAWTGSAGSHITDLKYCEFTGDYYPEIYYGRFSAQNTTQLQPQIDKTLIYEQYTMSNPNYLAEVTLVSGVDASYAATYGNGQLNYGTNYYFNTAHGITPNVWLYPASDASGANTAIIQTINDGVGLYNYTAHCSHDGPADPVFNQTNISNLTNSGKYLLGIGNCCQSNTFGTDYSTPAFGEAWMQAADKGGIGWIGCTNYSYWDEDYWWGVGNAAVLSAGPTYEASGQGAYDGLFHDHGEIVEHHYKTNAAIMFAGNTAVTEAGSSRILYYWEIYTLMGDPSIMSYMGIPAVNSVTHPSSITSTATSVVVSAAPYSYVGISRSNVLHGAGYIGSSGSATITITPFDTEGTADIVVTCQFKRPYVSTISVSGGTTPPTANFVGTPTSGAAPLTVTFTDQSTGATSWSWNFGDTGTSTDRNPVHVYNSVGTYTVSLTATNSYGSDVETKTNYITVSAAQVPVAAFTASATSVAVGQTVNFTDQSTNTPTSWAWTFESGNPTSSTVKNPSVIYNTIGTFDVTLIATNAAGSDTEAKLNYITVTVNYCASQGNSQADEWIAKVQVGSGINNSSGASPYTNFTAIVGNLTRGTSASVTLTPGYSGTIYTEYWRIWIDYNHDGDFADTGEQVLAKYGKSARTGTFTPPTTALTGTTRMRVSMKYGAYPTYCETFTYGEVEDYTVNIL